MVCEPCGDLPRSLLARLIELYEDVERWRESGGDARELRYVLDTAEQIDPQTVAAVKEQIREVQSE